MRARIYGRRTNWKPRPGIRRRPTQWLHWYASVTDPATGRIVWADDCRDLAKLADAARGVAHAFTVCAVLGQTFRSWADILDEAGL